MESRAFNQSLNNFQCYLAVVETESQIRDHMIHWSWSKKLNFQNTKSSYEIIPHGSIDSSRPERF